MKNFDNFLKKVLESMTTGSVFGTGQAHPAQPGQSSDFYAPGDARNIFGKPGKQKKKKIIRRKFPGL